MANTYKAYLLDNARRLAKSRRNDWPGMPLTSVPLAARGDVQALVREGKAMIVERPGKLDLTRKVAYLVAR